MRSGYVETLSHYINQKDYFTLFLKYNQVYYKKPAKYSNS